MNRVTSHFTRNIYKIMIALSQWGSPFALYLSNGVFFLRFTGSRLLVWPHQVLPQRSAVFRASCVADEPTTSSEWVKLSHFCRYFQQSCKKLTEVRVLFEPGAPLPDSREWYVSDTSFIFAWVVICSAFKPLDSARFSSGEEEKPNTSNLRVRRFGSSLFYGRPTQD